MSIGMFIDSKNIREMLRRKDTQESWRIVCALSIQAICALGILTEILKKELVSYEVTFGEQELGVELALSIGNEEWVLRGDAGGACTCGASALAAPAVVFGLAKALDFVNEQTVWPLAVAYSYYKEFLGGGWPAVEAPKTARRGPRPAGVEHTEQENPANRRAGQKGEAGAQREEAKSCRWCLDLYSSLVGHIKMLNSRASGIFFEKTSALLFLRSSSLSEALRSDASFLLSKGLFTAGPKTADRRIREILARAGISIATAAEAYKNVPHAVRGIVHTVFGTADALLYRNRFGTELSATEHAMLVFHYLYHGRPLDAVFCLTTHVLLDSEKAAAFHETVVGTFREAIASSRMLGSVAVLQHRGPEQPDCHAGVLCSVVGQLCHTYLARCRAPEEQRRPLVCVMVSRFRAGAGADKLYCLHTNDAAARRKISAARAGGCAERNGVFLVEAKDLATSLKMLTKDR